NRWFDKSLQFIFNTNGSIAFNIEHTMLDALPVLKLLNFIINHLDTSHTLSTPKQTPQNHSVQLLEFKLNTSIQQQLAMAKKDFATASSDIYTKAFEFTGFGSNLIKKAQVSPDAFMQIAFQLTYESIFHEFGTIYESVSTRQFSLARTEAMRSLTSELVAFIKGFKNQNISQTVKVELFRKAAKAHIDRIMECQNGLGVERHFFGLAQIAATSLPSTTPTLNAIFQSPGWQKLKYDKMSSSNCGSRDISFFGYGPTTLDGLGIGYTVLPEKIQICLTAHQKLQAQTKAFHQKLSQILKDLLELLA
ncbi:choline/carnitine O-acyltransferase, partial [bacterium]|nr:choline/carnitine O-acyltransferase [bacterium]